MITLTQAEARSILTTAGDLLKKRKLSNAINTEILQRYHDIKGKLYTPAPDATPEEKIAGYATDIEIDFPLFKLSSLDIIGLYQGDFLIGAMVKLFDLYE